MPQSRLRKAGVVLAGCGLAVVLLEGVVRWADPSVRDGVLPPGFLMLDATLGWRLRPTVTVSHRTRLFDVWYENNALGARDRPRNLSRVDHHKRILLFGDSQFFGWGVRDRDRFSNLIEDRTPNIEVWNLAVPAFGFDQQLLAYETGAAFANADRVVFFVAPLTTRLIGTGFAYQKFKPRFVLDERQVLRLQPVGRLPLLATAALTRVLSPWTLPYFLERRLPRLRSRARSDAAPLDDLMRALLERAFHMTSRRGHHMALIVAPGLPASTQAAVSAFSEGRGVEMIPLAFPGGAAQLLGAGDPHWSPATHRWVADYLARQPLFSRRADPRSTPSPHRGTASDRSGLPQ